MLRCCLIILQRQQTHKLSVLTKRTMTSPFKATALFGFPNSKFRPSFQKKLLHRCSGLRKMYSPPCWCCCCCCCRCWWWCSYYDLQRSGQLGRSEGVRIYTREQWSTNVFFTSLVRTVSNIVNTINVGIGTYLHQLYLPIWSCGRCKLCIGNYLGINCWYNAYSVLHRSIDSWTCEKSII